MLFYLENVFKTEGILEDLQHLMTKQFAYSANNEVDPEANTGPCFSIETCKVVLHYVSTTLLQHFHLFKIVFSSDQELQEISISKTLEFPQLAFEPLAEAMTLEALLELQEQERIEKLNQDIFDSSLGKT
jgi:hypothetical protein